MRLPDVAANPGSTWLMIGGALSVAAALLHIACLIGGPDWYRFFGAGEGMARAAARGDWQPTLITLAISTVLLIWAAYAFLGRRYIAARAFAKDRAGDDHGDLPAPRPDLCPAPSVAAATHRQLCDLVVADRSPLWDGLCHRYDQSLALSDGLSRSGGDGGGMRG